MMRSLFSGVSGLKNHQTRMDVIGNNISNVNTAGFKGSRVVFQDMLSQTIQSASSPQGNRGGTNPQQVGLGVGIGSIDTIYSDGNVQSTGKNTDLCISGNGFFIVSDGANKIYSRAGAFEFDEEGNYVIPGSGLKVQGWMADELGNVSSNGEVTDIKIPKGQTIPAKATDSLTYTKNLSSDAKVKETVTTTFDPSLIEETLPSPINTPNNPNPKKTVNKDGSIEEITISPVPGNPNAVIRVTRTVSTSGVEKIVTETLTDTSVGIYNDLDTDLADIQTDKTAADVEKDHIVDTTANANNAGEVIDNAINGANPVTNATDLDAVWQSYRNLYNALDVSGLNILTSNPPTNKAELEAKYQSSQKLESDLKTVIQALEALEAQIAAANIGANLPTVTPPMIATTVDDQLAASKATLNALLNTAEATTAQAKEAINVFGKIQSEGKSEVTDPTSRKSAAIVAYDSLGTAHTITGVFEKTGQNEWTFYPGVEKGNYDTQDTTLKRYTDTGFEISGGVYTLRFSEDGSLVSANGTPITFEPETNGMKADPIKITPDFSQLTQYSGDSTATCTGKTGYAAGTLDSVSIDTIGTIIGTYTNGLNRSLAQVAMATFNNPPGLTKTGNSLYQQSNNSGEAQISAANTGGAGKITPSSLEMSNVDLSEEFSNMIITQRGFQANSKIITTSDEMIEILTNLKR